MLDEAGRPILKLRVGAAATEGAANAAVIVLLAKALKRPRSAVRILSGETARVKRLEIDAAREDLVRAFGSEPESGSAS